MRQKPSDVAQQQQLTELASRAELLGGELAEILRTIHALPATQASPPSVQPSLLTPEQAAAALGLSRTAVFALIASGELGSVKIGSRRRVPRRAVDEYIERITAG